MKRVGFEKDIVPRDGSVAFYNGFDLEDNPWPDFKEEFDEWDRDYLESYKHYEEERKG